MAIENGLILRKIYQNIREKFNDLALYWNAILRIWNDTSPKEFYEPRVGGWKGIKIQQNSTIPVGLRYSNRKTFSNIANEVNQDIVEESSRIHTLGNENNIRRSVKSLNDITHTYIGSAEGYSKINVNVVGKTTSIDLASLGIKKYSQLTENAADIYNGSKLLSSPNETAIIEYNKDEITEEITQKDVLTFDVNTNTVLGNGEIVKKSDYEHINSVLNRIQTCLNKKSSWFSGGICARLCQTSCQNRCQKSCQGCNTKQCHDQKCGTH